MRKSDITGWQDVFSFTFIQTVKNKAYIIMLIIMLLLSFISVPLLSYISRQKGDDGGINPISRAYIYNSTSFDEIDFSYILTNEKLADIELIMSYNNYDEVVENIETNEHTAVAVKIYESSGSYFIEVLRSSTGEVKNSDAVELGNELSVVLSNYKVEVLELSEEQINLIYSQVDTCITRTSLIEEEGTSALVDIIQEDTSLTENEYWLIYAILFVVLMVNVVSSSQIASSIVSDKSSRVIEYLLTSIKPLAIIIGKVLAALLAVLVQMISIIIAMFASTMLTTLISGGVNIGVIDEYVTPNVLGNINLINIIISLIIIALGIIFYATIAGLAGAMVSRIEEASDSLMLFTILNIIGAYIGMGAAASLNEVGDNVFAIFAFIFPLSSPFLLPGALLVGKVKAWVVILSVIALLLAIMFLFRFVAKVYETLILHTGNRLKLKDVFRIAKNTELSKHDADGK